MVCCGLADSCRAQACGNHSLESTARLAEVPASILTAPINLEHGIGNAHEKVTTSSPRAQSFYDQGLSYLYSYDWIHAARSFHQALRLDPKLSMAYLGLSYVDSAFGSEDLAREMLGKAKDLADPLSPAERVRIDLRDQQFQAMQVEDHGKASSAFVTALDEALKSDGNNLNLLLMRGVAAEGQARAVGQRGGQESVRYYEKVLALDPENAAAHHFLIHSNEMLNNVAEAVHQGLLYQQLAPSVAHAHHMYGHDLRRTDQLRQAIAEFQQANRIAEAAYRNEPQSLRYDWNYRHNLNLLGSTLAQAGLQVSAAKTFKKLAQLPSIGPQDDSYKIQLAIFLLHEGRNREAIVAASTLQASRFEVGRVLGHAVAGSAWARKGDTKHAIEELQLAEKQAATIDARWYVLVDTRLETLRAQIDFLNGERERGTGRLRKLAGRARALPGADGWSEALFQLRFLALIAIQAGEWDLAKLTAQQLLEHADLYIGSHRLMAQLAEHDGDMAAAAREWQRVKQLERP